ncbi:MAG: hypothetical protein GY754_32840 [bacterium]|nr:hypothetical protein [bacterium]
MKKKPKKNRYRVKKYEGLPHGDLFEMEIDYHFDVIDKKTKKIIMAFTGDYSADLGGHCEWQNSQYSGVSDVAISDDGEFVLVYYYNKKDPERIKLPE